VGHTACNDRTIHLVRGRGDEVMHGAKSKTSIGLGWTVGAFSAAKISLATVIAASSLNI
jgi:hypothetical protein